MTRRPLADLLGFWRRVSRQREIDQALVDLTFRSESVAPDRRDLCIFLCCGAVGNGTDPDPQTWVRITASLLREAEQQGYSLSDIATDLERLTRDP